MYARPVRVLIAVCLGVFLTVGTAVASGDEMRREGQCTGHGDWRLEVRHDDADTLQVRFRIEHVPAGHSWQIFLSDNGSRFFAGTRTSSSNGEVRVRRLTHDRAGIDRIKGYGYDSVTGETCSGSIRYDR